MARSVTDHQGSNLCTKKVRHFQATVVTHTEVPPKSLFMDRACGVFGLWRANEVPLSHLTNLVTCP
jgi:hypothetical protein